MWLRVAIFCMLGAVPVVLLIAWVTTQFNYRITGTSLEVTLWGLCLRRIKLADIRNVSSHRPRHGQRAEHWWNTLHPTHRFLTVRRRSGWRKLFVITPKHRYVFRAELKQALAAFKAPLAPSEATDTDEPDEEEADGQNSDSPSPSAAP